MVGDLIHLGKLGLRRLELLSTEDLADQAASANPRAILGPIDEEPVANVRGNGAGAVQTDLVLDQPRADQASRPPACSQADQVWRSSCPTPLRRPSLQPSRLASESHHTAAKRRG